MAEAGYYFLAEVMLWLMYITIGVRPSSIA